MFTVKKMLTYYYGNCWISRRVLTFIPRSCFLILLLWSFHQLSKNIIAKIWQRTLTNRVICFSMNSSIQQKSAVEFSGVEHSKRCLPSFSGETDATRSIAVAERYGRWHYCLFDVKVRTKDLHILLLALIRNSYAQKLSNKCVVFFLILIIVDKKNH